MADFNPFQNPYSFGIKKQLFEILKERYGKHERLIDKISSTVVCPADYIEFGQFIIELYEVGFLKAVEEHKIQLEKMGLIASIKKP